ncbi:MAG: hypothetical protein C5B59_16195 [Bacteroidetes bacterium]|nr:MAG: hypothetical protein C5B59_16195 [Bacteroidota bacterium]
MKKGLLAIFLFIGIPGLLTYKDSVNKFTIEYPNNWTTKSDARGIAFLSPMENDSDGFQENFSVVIQDLSNHPISLNQYVGLTKDILLKQYQATDFENEKLKTFAGRPATGIIYKMHFQGHELKVRQYFFIANKTVFIIAYTAEPSKFAKYEGTAMQAITSFKFY